MANKFVSWLEAKAKDINKVLTTVLKFAPEEEAAVSAFAPELGPLFNSTVTAVTLAEQSGAAIGAQAKTGPQKLAAVVGIAGPLIAQGLTIAGKPADNAAVQNYISSVVTILNTVPAPTPATPTA